MERARIYFHHVNKDINIGMYSSIIPRKDEHVLITDLKSGEEMTGKVHKVDYVFSDLIGGIRYVDVWLKG